MKECYLLREGSLVKCSPEEASVLVFVGPNEAEKAELLAAGQMDPHSLDSALDPDETSRVEFDFERADLIWKRPTNASFDQQLRFAVSSAGLFLLREKLLVVLEAEPPPLSGKEFQKLNSLNDVALRYLLHSIHHYSGHLRVMKMLTSEIQAKLNRTMENIYFIQLFVLSESLIYYLDAPESNMGLLERLQKSAGRLRLSPDEIELLDDILVEQRQCIRQTQIYSQVLAGLMDARGTIINNNMNVLLKNLTVINIIFLPLNLLAGIGGMSEYSMMTGTLDWRLSYALFLIAMVLVGWGTWKVIHRVIDPSSERDKRKRKVSWKKRFSDLLHVGSSNAK